MKQDTTLRNPALLVIDVQDFFFKKGAGAFLTGSGRILPRINRLIDLAQQEQWPIAYTTHCGPVAGNSPMARWWRRLPTGDQCRLHRGLSIASNGIMVTKQHYSAFHETGLGGALKRHGVSDIVLCGVMTNLCVETTARHGFMLGFSPVVVADACCANTAQHHRASLMNLRYGFARVVSAKVLQGMAKSARP